MEILEINDIGITVGAGGIERHVRNLCNLFKSDEDITLFKPEWESIKYNKILRKNYIYNKEELVSKIDKFKIVHIHGYMSLMVLQFLVICHKHKKIIIYSPHFHPFSTLNHPFLGRMFFCLLKPYLKHITKIFTINEEDTSFFRKYSKRVVKIPHWYELVTNCDTESCIKRHPNRILFVAKNTPDKGLSYLYKLPQNKYDIHCVTNGRLERKDFYQHSNISDAELKQLYITASLVVCPSRYEAFSYVVLEALMNKTPILISDRVRIADYLKNISGVTIFHYGDYDDFKKKVDKAMCQNVDIDAVMKIFSKDKIKEMYKKEFLSVTMI